ncbi:MAG: VWA domain-containing protein [Deltaproteobacteria bacterium]|nr:VWA domain-containing protein [Deltaproteobacteria bacterium]
MRNRHVAGFLAAVLFACGSVSGEPGDGSGDGGDAGPSDGAGDTSADSPGDLPTDGDERLCTIDLVFAVDNSGSMQEEIRDFRDNVWPALADALLTVSGGAGGDPFRAAVIDACPDPASFHTRGESGECDFESAEVWMESDSSDLEGEFQCVGDIWDGDRSCTGDNDDEQPASAAAEALSSPWTDADGANFGFVRSGALLIVIAITDEDETPVPDATAADIFDKIVAVKGGDPKKVVFLGIGGASDCSGPYGNADEAVMLKQVADLFIAEDRGIFWDLCGGALADGLTDAMTVIDVACEDLII